MSWCDVCDTDSGGGRRLRLSRRLEGADYKRGRNVGLYGPVRRIHKSWERELRWQFHGLGGQDANAAGLLNTEQYAAGLPSTTWQIAAPFDFQADLVEHR